jgi:crotonobetainyl-CoA:carnitine CoA-transferase CaiB-like acyl-CoA transferase
MGQFTTAPLVGRQLGALGADVVKLEPAGGEPSRHMPPHRNGQGFFFTLSNSEKRVMKLDLREAGRVSLLEELIAKADVLVENTKPGTLPRHGFTPSRVLEINPRIVYCAISGFGEDAPFAGLGAMDTTIQGLSGVMDLNREDGTPYKTGVSIADLHAGQFALVAVLAALEARDRTGKGQHIDLAMLDAAAWATRCQWMQNGAAVEQHVIPCADGYVLCEGGGTQLPSIGAEPRAQAVATMAACGLRAAPVLSLAEVMEHPQTKAKGVIAEGRSPVGEDWPLVTSPIVMSRTHTSVRRAPGALNFDAASVIDTWGLKWREAAQS